MMSLERRTIFITRCLYCAQRRKKSDLTDKKSNAPLSPRVLDVRRGIHSVRVGVIDGFDPLENFKKVLYLKALSRVAHLGKRRDSD